MFALMGWASEAIGGTCCTFTYSATSIHMK